MLFTIRPPQSVKTPGNPEDHSGETMKGARAGITTMIISSILLQGCSTMSREECLNADWQQVGYSDSYMGYDKTRLDDHRKACARADVSVEFNDYQAGWDRGNREYCTPDMGRREGQSGRRYRGVCPGELEPGFLAAYEPAYEIYKVERTIRSLESALKRLQDQARDNQEEISELQFAMARADDQEQRLRYLEKLNKLESKQLNLQKEQAEKRLSINEQQKHRDSLNSSL
ncbi:MAG: DUF2799 domain-containing protein [Endozoicomonas sp.]